MRDSFAKILLFVLLLLEINLVSSATTAPSRSPTLTPSKTPTVVPTTAIPSICPTVSPSSFLSIYNNIALVAGASSTATSSSGAGGKATSASFVNPIGLFQDSVGLLYVVDNGDNCVFNFNPTTDSIVRTFAGVCGSSGDQQNKPATSALLYGIFSVHGDTSGNIFLADNTNNKVKKVNSVGYISLYAGNGGSGQSGDGGQATAANIAYPHDVFMDTLGVLFILINAASTVRTVAINGIISSYAGVSGSNTYSGDGGAATSAKLNSPTRALCDTNGVLYISDASNYRIRQVSTSGIISLYAGTGSTAYLGENLPPTSANINHPVGIAIDGVSGDVYFSDNYHYRVYLVSKSSGLVNTFAGSGTAGNSGNGGAATAATFNDNRIIVLDTSGNLYIQDTTNANVRVVYDGTPTVSPTVVPTTSIPTMVPTTSIPTVLPTTSIPTTASPSSVRSSQNNVYLYAGTGTGSTSGTGGQATAATVYQPRSVWQDTAGVTYFSEQSGNCVRKVSTAGIVSVYAGVCTTTGSYGGDNGAASSANFNSPNGLFISTVGVGYIAEYSNNRVRKVSTAGIITTYAGSGSTTNSGNGGAATSGGINQCHGLWLNSVGVLYVTSLNSDQVRSVSAGGILSLFVGTGTSGYSGDGGQATAALINGAEKLTGDSTGVVYVADSGNNRVRKVSTTGIISLVMGSGSTSWGSENIAATSANVYFPDGLWTDSANSDMYVSARSVNRIVVLTATTGLLSTYAGTGTGSSTGDGGAATSATLYAPDGLYLTTGGVLYVTEVSGHKIRKIYSVSPTMTPTAVPSFGPSGPTLGPTPGPTVQPSYSQAPTVVPTSTRSALNNMNLYVGTGTGSSTGTGGAATSATVNQPRSVWQDTAGVTYFSEQLGNCARKISATGIVSVYAGVCTTTGSFTGDNAPASSAGMNNPVGLFVSTVGVGYIAEFNNNRVRSVTTSGIIATYAGSGSTTNSGNGGAATAGGIYQCHGLWLNSVGVLYVTSVNSHQVRSVSAGGILSLFVGTGTSGYSGDGGQATVALINGAEKLTGDSTGVVYIADSNNNRVRKVSTTGIISLVMGSGSSSWGSENVPATSVSIFYPAGMWKDSANSDMYVSARSGNRLVVLTATTGLVSSFAGTGTATSNGDGGAATSATLYGPDGLYLTDAGVMYVTEVSGHKIRRIYSVSPTMAPSAMPSFAPSGPSYSPSFVPTVLPTSARSEMNNIFLVAGTGTASSTGNGGLATAATINFPRSAWHDTTGSLYFTETNGDCIRRISTTNIVYAFGGTCGTSGYGGDNGAATSAKFAYPVGLQVDTTGVLFFTDLENHRVRTISTAGIVSTYVGTGSYGNTGDNGPATSAKINEPNGISLDSAGVLYFTTYATNTVKTVSSANIITLIAGTSSSGYGGDGGPATSAVLQNPERVIVSTMGLLYVSDSSNNRVRLISANTITTLVGTGGSSYSGENVAATSAGLNYVSGSALDSENGDLYVFPRSACRILVMTGSSGRVTTYAGTGSSGSSGDGGAATSATLYGDGLYLESSGKLYVMDYKNNKIRVIYSVAPTVLPSVSPTAAPTILPSGAPSVGPSAIPSIAASSAPTFGPTFLPTNIRSTMNSVFLVAGTGTAGSTGTGGLATAATLSTPRSVWQDTTGSLYFVETTGYCIRKFSTSTYIVFDVAGTCGSPGFGGDNGPATSAKFSFPVGMQLDTTSVLFLADLSNNRVRQVSVAGIVSTFAGTGTSGNTGNNGQATSADIYNPSGISLSSTGVLYVSLHSANAVRCVSTAGIITLIAGTGTGGFSGDGGPATSATLQNPERTIVSSVGLIYISDSSNNRVRLVSASTISTLVGTGSTTYTGENVAATSVGLNYVTGTALDTSNGDLYLYSRTGYRILVMTGNSGIVTTYAGTGSSGSSGDGGAATSATLYGDGLYLESSGKLYVADYENHKIRVIYSVAPSIAPTVLPSVSPTASPSAAPSVTPTVAPTAAPVVVTSAPIMPSVAPSCTPTEAPSTSSPSLPPSQSPTLLPSVAPTALPSKAHSAQNSIFLVAGTGSESSSGTGGLATAAALNNPRAVWKDTSGILYWAEFSASCIRAMNIADNVVFSYAGTCGSSGESVTTAAATSGVFMNPISIIGNTVGTVYVNDYLYRVRLISNDGVMSLYGGSGDSSDTGDGGPATSAGINQPLGSWLDSVGTLYLAVALGNRIRAISAGGIISTVAGTGSSSFSGDGGPATSAGFAPERVWGLSSGALFLTDPISFRVRQISPAGIISTFAGTGSNVYNGENLAATSASLVLPVGVVTDNGNYDTYISDRSSHRLLVVTASSGLVTTYAGTGVAGNTGNGEAATSCTISPDAMFLDNSNNLYVADVLADVVRVVSSVAPTVLPTASPTQSPSHLPSVAPSWEPTLEPSIAPTAAPTLTATAKPSLQYGPVSSSPSYKVANAFAFAGITSGGGVVSWGAACCGGDSSSVSGLLDSEVTEVVQSKNAFAALKSDGSVVAWGAAGDVSGSSTYQTYTTIMSLVATERAFAGVTSDGGVIAFGADCCGGNVDQYGWAQYLTSGVSSVRASAGAVCALKSDGTVYCWGSKFAGGGVSSLTRSDLSGIVMLSSTRSAFAGMTSGGSVVVWGTTAFGGSMSDAVKAKLDGNTQWIVSGGLAFVGSTLDGGLVSWGSVKDGVDSSVIVGNFKFVAHTASAFAALRFNGTLSSWGSSRQGGDSSSVASSLQNVSYVVGNTGAFAAVTAAGDVIAWGDNECGGKLWANVSSTIGSGVTEIMHTTRAFAVLDDAGAVTAWGASSEGGTIDSSFASQLTSEVKLICANDNGFTAIKSDGTAYGWGSSSCFQSGIVDGEFSAIIAC